MVQGTKRKKKEKKKSQTIQGKTWKTQMNTHTKQNKNKEKNKQKVKKPHPGQGEEGGYGGSKWQRCLARDRELLEEMTGGFLWGKPQALTQKMPNLGNGVSS